MGLQPRGGANKPALIFGDIWHQSLAKWYQPGRKRGPKPWRTFEKLYMEFRQEHGRVKIRDLEGVDDEAFEIGEVGIELAHMYVNHYGEDEDIEIISPEYPFYVKLIDRGGKSFYVVGRMDALAIWVPHDETCLVEHKTGSERKKKNLQLDEQGGTYWTFGPKQLKRLGIIDRVSDVDMILYNFARKAKRDERPQNKEGLYLNKDGSVSKRQPADVFERIPVYRSDDDRLVLTDRIKAEAQEIRLARAGKMAIYKNATDDCSWDCQFLDMCELHEAGSDYQSFMDQMYRRGDPLERYDDVRTLIKEVKKIGNK
jgi:hypothetical protein